jgi:uncharacterized protein YegL
MERNRPGGLLATRPLHFVWLCDCSGSMSVEGKVQSLNSAIHESLPHMREMAAQNPFADVLVRAVAFSHGARWHVETPVAVDKFHWTDLEADPLTGGKTRADILFLVDTSGSMHSEIEGVKRGCQEFADRIIAEGATVRLGLVGFDIGGHSGTAQGYTVQDLSRYTIGLWPLADPPSFKRAIASLRLGLFGGGGCYLANQDTVDIFPRVVAAFDDASDAERILVVVSDEIGGTAGLDAIVRQLQEARITTHVLGVARRGGAHEQIAARTGGRFWDITSKGGGYSFDEILQGVASTIAEEIKQHLADGTLSSGTDLGAALRLVSRELQVPPMAQRALPPVLALVSDGRPTDDFESALADLMRLPWGQKAVRIAIGIGCDADLGELAKFIGTVEIKPLLARNAQELTRYIRWASTAVVAAASAPPSQAKKGSSHVPIPSPPSPLEEASHVW